MVFCGLQSKHQNKSLPYPAHTYAFDNKAILVMGDNKVDRVKPEILEAIKLS